MKQLYYAATFLLIILLNNCNCKEVPLHREKKEMKLSFQVIPEDIERSVYIVEWKDTLGFSAGYLDSNFIKRPLEVWCVITNKKNDTLGCYKRLSQKYFYLSEN